MCTFVSFWIKKKVEGRGAEVHYEEPPLSLKARYLFKLVL